ncbi:MAG: element excision factor XisI family protein, partial [Bacteroidota bacterium]
DESSGSYLVLTYGWTAERFLHFVVFHFAIKEDGKIWLYQNRTNKVVLEDLAALGIVAEDVVLALVEPYCDELVMVD